jgi:tRNA A37 threonylcarbamoyladenosine dehydratase
VAGNGRDRAVNGTISYMPALFGLTIAGMVIKQIIAENLNINN